MPRKPHTGKYAPHPQCRTVSGLLLGYLDGGLSAVERQAVASHLDTCDACRAELALCRRSEEALLTSRLAIPVPGDLSAGFYARLHADNVAQRQKWTGWKLAVPAAACGMLALLWFRLPVVPEAAPSETTETEALATGQRHSESFSEMRRRSADNGAGARMTVAPDTAFSIASSAKAPSRLTFRRAMPKTSLAWDGVRASAQHPQSLSNTPTEHVGNVKMHLDVRVAATPAPDLSLAASHKGPVSQNTPGFRSNATVYLDSERQAALYDKVSKGDDLPEHKAEADALIQEGRTAFLQASASGDVAGVDIEVCDEARGFRKRVRHTAKVEEQNGSQVITIEAQDTDEATREEAESSAR